MCEIAMDAKDAIITPDATDTLLRDFLMISGVDAVFVSEYDLTYGGGGKAIPKGEEVGLMGVVVIPVEGGALHVTLPSGSNEGFTQAAIATLTRLWASLRMGEEAMARKDLLLTLIMEKRRAEEAALRSYAGAYPIHKEKELLSNVRLGDRSGARRILNEMLGWVFLNYEGSVDVIKARVLELLSMVSRAAVETGAPLGLLLSMNNRNMVELLGIHSFDGVCAWVVRALDAFMDVVYNSRDVETTRFISVALKFMHEHYQRPLTLESVAKAAHISQYYLSHLFRRELSATFLEKLTFIRMENACRLLRDTDDTIRVVARAVGYDDAGYFAKVFRKVMGETPRRYRELLRVEQDITMP